MFRERTLCHISRARPGFPNEETLIPQERYVEVGRGKQLVIRMSDHDELVLPPIMNVNALVRHWTFDERDVDLKANEHAEDRASVRAGHPNSDAWVGLVKSTEYRGQEIGRDGSAGADT